MEETESKEIQAETPAAAGGVRRKFESLLSALDAEVKKREAAVEDLEEEPGGPETEWLMRKASLRIAQKERELYLFKHDNTGAKDGRLWGVDFSKKLPERIPGETGEGLEPSGEIKVLPEDDMSHTLVVNTGELDRFNAEGGHEAGDKALEKTSETAELIILEELRKAGIADGEAYDIYRFGGNDFLVDLRGVTESVADQIRDRISETRPEVISGKDPLPMASIRFSRSEVLGTLNAAIKESGATLSPKVARDLLVDTTRLIATVASDVEKMTVRAERVREKIGSSSAADLREFWTKFMQKSFKDTEFDSLDVFVAEAAKGEVQFQSKILEAAFQKAGEAFAQESAIDGAVRRILYGKLSEIFSGRSIELPEPETGKGEKPGREKLELAGRTAIAESASRASRARKHVEKLPPTSPEKPLAELGAREAGLDEQIEKARRDGLTGLLGRREHYRRLEERLERGEKSGVVFVDMAFLKYFDKEGQGDTGDYALQKAAEIMEQAIAALEVDAEAFRYGGDEFTIQFAGDAKVGKKIIDEITRRAEEMKPIAESEKATARYRPEKLQFNYGLADTKLLADSVKEITTDPVVPRERKEAMKTDPNQRAELMTKLADLGIDEQKAENRLKLMVRRLSDPRYEKDKAYRIQTDALLAYSEKAVMGATADDFKTWSKMTVRERAGAIQTFVSEKLDRKIGEREHLDRSLSEIILSESKVLSLDRQLGRMASSLERAEKKYDREHAVVLELQKRITIMERERKELVEARGTALAA